MSKVLHRERWLAPLRETLQQNDPHADVQFDSLNGQLRVRSRLTEAEVALLASALGLDLQHVFPTSDIRQRGSECCGGCGG